MRFKIDENLPVEIAEMLNNAGYDSKSVNDEGLQGVKDSHLIDICKKENRILVTLDTDFSDIRNYSLEDFSGVIVLRLKAQTKFHVINVFKNVIPQSNLVRQSGRATDFIRNKFFLNLTIALSHSRSVALISVVGKC